MADPAQGRPPSAETPAPRPAPPEGTETSSRRWHDVAAVEALTRTGVMRVELTGIALVLAWHDGRPWALDDVCIHRQRSLAEGTLFQGRLICPGHQWAFALDTGLCRERDRCQPVHPACVEGDRVLVGLPDPP